MVEVHHRLPPLPLFRRRFHPLDNPIKLVHYLEDGFGPRAVGLGYLQP